MMARMQIVAGQEPVGHSMPTARRRSWKGGATSLAPWQSIRQYISFPTERLATANSTARVYVLRVLA